MAREIVWSMPPPRQPEPSLKLGFPTRAMALCCLLKIRFRRDRPRQRVLPQG